MEVLGRMYALLHNNMVLHSQMLLLLKENLQLTLLYRFLSALLTEYN